MDAPAAPKPPKINRWLPYWAVFQEDLRQTLRNWVFRSWVLVSLLAGVGYLLYKVGVYRGAGMVQLASTLMSDLLRWTVLGSVTLIGVLTAGTISGERGTMADSVLSRGISRYQYFLAKWHARLVLVLGTFFVLGLAALGGSFLLQEDLSPAGSLVALATVAALLAVVISCGVTVSTMVNSTVTGIMVLSIGLYGAAIAMAWLPAAYPSPDRTLASLPFVLRGTYDLTALGRLAAGAAAVSGVAGLFGLILFARRDV